MARPRKVGLDYFPLDTVLDMKIECLEAEHGLTGFAVWIKILQLAYQSESGEANFTDVIRRKTFGKRLGITWETIEPVIDTCLNVGLFERNLWETSQVLSSNGIRARIDAVSTERAKDRERQRTSPVRPLKENTKKRESKSRVKGKSGKLPGTAHFPSDNSSPTQLPESFNSYGVAEALNSWIDYRKEIKRPLVASSISAIVKTWAPLGELRFCAAVEFTISKGWQGLREDDRLPMAGNGTPRDFIERRTARQETVVEKAKALRAAQDAIMNPKQNKLAVEEN